MNTDSSKKRRQHLGQELFFWSTAVAVLFIFLGRNALWGSEDRWAEIVREMLLTGDYFHPTLNFQVYYDKPLLSYWFILPFAQLFGAASELAARIPSALAALLALWSLKVLAKELFSLRTARLAPWMLLGCYGFLFWGRAAAADMANLTAVIAATAWFFHVEKKPGFFGYLVFFLIVFAGGLTKGTPALIVPCALLIPYLLWSGSWKRHFADWRFYTALFLCAALFFAAFYIPALLPLTPPQHYPGDVARSSWELFWQENVVRVFNAFDHKDPWYSYFYNLPRILLPWAPLLAVGIAGVIRRWRDMDKRALCLLAGVLFAFLLFTLSGSRRWYYVLPLAPFCVLYGSAGLCRFGLSRWNRLGVNITWYIVIFAASLFISSLLLWPLWGKVFHFTPPLEALLAPPIAGALAWTALLIDYNPGNIIVRLTGLPRRLGSAVIGVTLLVAAIMAVVIPAFTVFRSEKSFFRLVQQQAIETIPDFRQNQIIFYCRGASPKYLYYNNLTAPVSEFSSLSSAAEKLPDCQVALLIRKKPRVIRQLQDECRKLGIPFNPDQPFLLEPSHSWEATDYKNNAYAVYLVKFPAKLTQEKK